jgi:hypothetical protein
VVKKLTVRTACDACRSTGLYQGFCEPKGTAVICCDCGGTGCKEISYTPFERRRRKKGIREIRTSRSPFIATGVGGVGEPMTYKEFERKIPPV